MTYTSPTDYAEWMKNLEQFLTLLRNTELTNRQVLMQLYLLKLPFFMRLTRDVLLKLPREQYQYSEEVETFLSCCDTYPNLLEDLNALHYISTHPTQVSIYPNERIVIDAFLCLLHQQLQEPKISNRINERKQLVNDNIKDKTQYVNALFTAYPKLLVIRVDFYYKKEVDANLNDLIAHIERFYNNKRSNALFNDMVGYVIKLEYGVDRKFHAHVMLFFDNDKLKCKGDDDVTLAWDICNYWVNSITKGMGDYHNCQAYKSDYEKSGRLGIGQIKADDIKKRENLIKTVVYFCKKEQFVKLKSNPKMKLIRRMAIPK